MYLVNSLITTKHFVRDFDAKGGREHIFQPTIGSLHDTSNEEVGVVHFETSNTLIFKSIMFQHRNT